VRPPGRAGAPSFACCPGRRSVRRLQGPAAQCGTRPAGDAGGREHEAPLAAGTAATSSSLIRAERQSGRASITDRAPRPRQWLWPPGADAAFLTVRGSSFLPAGPI
jgi:hypothetical protein